MSNRIPIPPASDDMVNITAARREGEVYVVIYEDHQRKAALKAIGDWARHPELPFGWAAAAAMAYKMRAAK